MNEFSRHRSRRIVIAGGRGGRQEEVSRGKRNEGLHRVMREMRTTDARLHLYMTATHARAVSFDGLRVCAVCSVCVCA